MDQLRHLSARARAWAEHVVRHDDQHLSPGGCHAAPETLGSGFPLVAALQVKVKNPGGLNSFRILMDWPRLRVWTNQEPVQDLDLETVPELRHRLRSGYLGLESLSYPI